MILQTGTWKKFSFEVIINHPTLLLASFLNLTPIKTKITSMQDSNSMANIKTYSISLTLHQKILLYSSLEYGNLASFNSLNARIMIVKFNLFHRKWETTIKTISYQNKTSDGLIPIFNPLVPYSILADFWFITDTQ